MKHYQVSKDIVIECWTMKTRSGTREHALIKQDDVEVAHGSYFWSNRPWQRFTYSEAINNALARADCFEDPEKAKIMSVVNGEAEADLKQNFGVVSAIAMMGEVLCSDKKEKNEWKARMLKAGLPGLDIPEDWDTLSEDEKESRLNKVIEFSRGEA